MICDFQQIGHGSKYLQKCKFDKTKIIIEIYLIIQSLFHRLIDKQKIYGSRNVANEKHDGNSAQNVQQRVVSG
jgi:hypothetical protein